ncbi:hypothetical protein [Burkholderia ubonensis]|uniref:hypothetical protein n=1 Tax=Burkholderia ubonensis TaxID=101571 RepID=UPI001583B554|nr:hypothetical protein [Burkholderia ubonensis]
MRVRNRVREAGFGCGNGGFRVIERARIDIFEPGYEAANCGYLFGSQWTEMGAILLICMYYDRGSAAFFEKDGFRQFLLRS